MWLWVVLNIMDYLISKQTMLSILTNYGLDVAQKIKKNQEIVEELRFRKDHPMAMNYATFEQWVTELLGEKKHE